MNLKFDWWRKFPQPGTRRPTNKRRQNAALKVESLEQRLVLSTAYATVNDWGSGLQGQIAITNDQAAPIQGWRLEFDYGRSINNIWDAVIVSRVGNHYVVQNASYNSQIQPGQTITFGFVAGSGSDVPQNIVLNGSSSTPPVSPSITIGDIAVTEGNPSTSAVSGFFHTSGNQILDEINQTVRIAGVNWFADISQMG